MVETIKLMATPSTAETIGKTNIPKEEPRNWRWTFLLVAGMAFLLAAYVVYNLFGKQTAADKPSMPQEKAPNTPGPDNAIGRVPVKLPDGRDAPAPDARSSPTMDPVPTRPE